MLAIAEFCPDISANIDRSQRSALRHSGAADFVVVIGILGWTNAPACTLEKIPDACRRNSWSRLPDKGREYLSAARHAVTSIEVKRYRAR